MSRRSTAPKKTGAKLAVFVSIPLILVFFLFLSGFIDIGTFPWGKSTQVSSQKADSLQVETILNKMSLREKVGQLFVVSADGYFENRQSDAFLHLQHAIQDEHIGGIILFHGTVYGQAMLINKLQQMSTIPLWVTEDMEFGSAMRVNDGVRFIPPMGVAATGNVNFAYQSGRITALEAKALGVNQIFAPVVDVNNNPANPVINVRSYSQNPDTVAKYASAFVRGVSSEGVIATAKHFPGHGDTHVDSHIGLPVVHYGYQHLDSLELVPFRRLIDQGVPSIMTAHIAFPKISGNPDLPGTLDPDIIKGILRDSLDYHGLVITDALNMGGVSENYSPAKDAVMAIKAGTDLLLMSPDVHTAINAVVDAVHDGQLTEQRINRSVRKLLMMKVKQGLIFNPFIDLDQLDQTIHATDNEIVSREIARKSITLLRNRHDILPIDPQRYPRVTVIAMSDDKYGETGDILARRIRKYHPDVRFHIFDDRTCAADLHNVYRDVRWANLVIIGSFIHVQTGKNLEFNALQRHFLSRLPRYHKRTVMIAFGSPYVLSNLPGADVQVCAWSSSNEQVEQTVPALFGASTIDGHLPTSIPPNYKIGDGLTLPKTIVRFSDIPEEAGFNRDSLYRVDQIMNKAIDDSVFPGGVVTVLRNGIVAYCKGFGYQTYQKMVPDRKNDIFDMASLTKVVATTSCVMKLYQEGKLNLDDHVSKYFPEYSKGEKAKITLKNLLTHTSGLPPDNLLTKKNTKSPQAFMQDVLNTPLMNPPNTKYVYSDLNFIIMGAIVQKVTGMPLDKYAESNIFAPLGMNHTMFNPLKKRPWLKHIIVPTEIDTIYRHELLKGIVNDERSYYMGGVAGHAGLFSTGPDLAAYAQMLLNGGTYNGVHLYKPSTIHLFTTKESDISDRGYGFDLKTPEGFSTAGQLTSDKTFGHLGFTGTSMWIDPTRNLAIILLTNREFPHRGTSHDINLVRSHVADAVVSSLMSH